MPENTAFLFGAFAITWLLIFGYCLFIGGRIGGLRQHGAGAAEGGQGDAPSTPSCARGRRRVQVSHL